MSRLYMFTLFSVSALVSACGDEEAAEEAPAEAAPAEEAPATEGEPVVPTPKAQTVAGLSVTAEACAIEGHAFTGDSSMGMFKSVAVHGEHVMVIDGEGRLMAFEVSTDGGCSLKLASDFGEGGIMTFDKEVDWTSSGGDTLIASSGVFETQVIRGGSVAYTCEADGYIELSADGSWGIAPWVNATVEKVTFDETSCKAQPWVLQDLSDEAKRKGPFAMTQASAVIGDKIYIGGSLAKSVDPDESRVIIAFTPEGKEVGRIESKDDATPRFGWIHAINACKPGICVLDSNYRRITMWDDKGASLGELDLKALLGLSYPWIKDFAVGSDGASWLVAANDRAEGELADGFIYRVTGLADGSAKAPPAAGKTKAGEAARRPRGTKGKRRTPAKKKR